MKNNIEKIVESVLIQNRIRDYDKKDLELQLQIHPNYPSFQSITDTLDYFSIDNIAVEVPIDALDQLPESFVSLIKIDQAEEIVAVIKKNNSITLKHSTSKQKNFSLDEFKEIWIPKVIAVELNTKTKLFSNRSILQNILLLVVFVSLAFTFIGRSWDISQIVFLLLSFTGVVFSFYAVRESLGIQSQTMHQFCTSVGKTNCGDVINNNSGKLFKGFSLADAGMVFFGTLSLYQIFFGFSSILMIPALIGIPFILYSFYSQALVIKKWCAVCIAMGSISVGLAVIAVLNLSFDINLYTITNFIMISSLFTLGYLFIKEKIKDNKDFKSENVKLNHFKRDGQIFNHLLSISEKIKDNQSIEHEIILGNPDSEFKIISLTNPMCGYCKDAFEGYMRVIKSLGKQLQIIIRLRVNLDNVDNEATQISLRLLEIYTDEGQENFITAYNDWFKDRTFSKWIHKYNKPSNKPEHLKVLKKQSEWADQNELYYTPASLIGHTLYPKKYSYNEFFHFISVLAENHNEMNTQKEQPVEIS
ncbi:vitamin K epoxide reductase family protein [Aquimarina sp. MMG016]|uniref:vitamin K epoxide reductase family protein n=1 Tax=Aquimarina sp. MMG016 TaxID=2822690 RepID=UPI001B3A5C7D|nr:vitamin K epoxide reductase family protein [Aquimarina sp. MMG016]MBQ4818788.1 thioredoxin domain-containing protein [Aquimarina sp. MMG016]